ncbi:hypothetical protein GPX89_23010 [Nocardia sp. ET3-3]|uniref:Uncharacterized protein n=2 Tax=Nocardia terrae TaxID=2675851 RepID=A0A7K1V0D8_9NOCA|nr:hypothetical protein [Nocardia terrae]
MARAATNTDAIVLEILTEAQQALPSARTAAGPCPLRGMRRTEVVAAEAPGVRLAATASLLLGAAKIRDHVDDGDTHRLARRPLTRVSTHWHASARAAAAPLGLDVGPLLAAIESQLHLENSPDSTLDELTAPTQLCAAELFAHTAILADRPENSDALREAGWHFGRIAHLADAIEDLDTDRAQGHYNPLLATGTTPEQAHDLVAESNSLLRAALTRVALDRTAEIRWILLDPLGGVVRKLGRAAGIAHTCATRACGTHAKAVPGTDPTAADVTGPPAGTGPMVAHVPTELIETRPGLFEGGGQPEGAAHVCASGACHTGTAPISDAMPTGLPGSTRDSGSASGFTGPSRTADFASGGIHLTASDSGHQRAGRTSRARAVATFLASDAVNRIRLRTGRAAMTPRAGQPWQPGPGPQFPPGGPRYPGPGPQFAPPMQPGAPFSPQPGMVPPGPGVPPPPPPQPPSLLEGLGIICTQYCTGYACCAWHTGPCSGQRKRPWIEDCDCCNPCDCCGDGHHHAASAGGGGCCDGNGCCGCDCGPCDCNCCDGDCCDCDCCGCDCNC